MFDLIQLIAASIRYTAEAHADIPWGKDQRKKVELFVQSAKDLNDEMETLEKVSIIVQFNIMLSLITIFSI